MKTTFDIIACLVCTLVVMTWLNKPSPVPEKIEPPRILRTAVIVPDTARNEPRWKYGFNAQTDLKVQP